MPGAISGATFEKGHQVHWYTFGSRLNGDVAVRLLRHRFLAWRAAGG